MISCPDHRPRQHRDRRPAWCRKCGLTEEGQVPTLPITNPNATRPKNFIEPAGYDNWIKERSYE